jgi:hypothetical protein
LTVLLITFDELMFFNINTLDNFIIYVVSNMKIIFA